MADALARKLGARSRIPSVRPGPTSSVKRPAPAPASDGEPAANVVPAADGAADDQPPAPPAYDAGPNVARSSAEIFRARFETIEQQARIKRSHQFVAAAVAAIVRGEYHAAADAYRQAAELDPDDTTLVRKLEEVEKLARRYRR